MFKIITLTLILIVLNITLIYSQNEYEKDYIKIAPGEQYKAGWLHEFIFGEHWRDSWTKPINVEILDLNKFAGGLKPLKRGGGFQTKSLRLLGKDGNIWKFRSMAKDPAKILPKILRETVVADIFQDQISSANPLAALVAAPILSSIGVLQSKPYLVYMPDDELLGEFREDFGNQLGMMEIHPDVDDGRDFEGADKIKSTFKLFDRLANKRKEKVDAISYLKARIIDIILGDWDRHTDQWKWARYEESGKSYWKPIPRDRDQVFAKWDGLGPRIAAYLVPQFVHFDYEYPDIEDMTWSGRFVDRRFLTELTQSTWDSVTVWLKAKLTDEIIANAVNSLPQEQYELVSEEIITKLKSRRDLIIDYSKEYYQLINTVVDIYATNKDDIVEIKRLNNNETSILVYDLKKKSKSKNVLYKKIFDSGITDDIRVYLLDGDDKVIITGEVDRGPMIRIIGGSGKDILEDSSKVNGYLFSILPIRQPDRKTQFYDSGKKSKIKSVSRIYINKDKLPTPSSVSELYEPQQRDRSVDWLPSPILGFNTNDGLSIGLGAQIYGYNFRMTPYEYWMNLTAAYSTRPKSFSYNFNGIFNSLIRGSTVTLDITNSELLFTNYYGFGNETKFDDQLEDDEFYRIDEELFSVESAIHLNYFGNISGSIGFNYRNTRLELNNEKLQSTFKDDYGLNNFNLLKIFSEFNIDTRDGINFPLKGYYANVRTSVYPKFLENKSTFFKLEAKAAYFATLNTFTDFTFVLRAGGGIVTGTYPFFESIFIGGDNDLRGYSRRRFAGDSGIYGQLEMRSYLFPLKIIVPGKFGFHSFIESGRVYDNLFPNSQQWHASYGGGFWMTFAENAASLSISFAESKESSAIYISLGMGF